MTTIFERYQRIAPVYDLLDLPFEHGRYRQIRPHLFAGLGGDILDAGVGTGRNMAFYPDGAHITGIDLSPAMLARARRRTKASKAASIDLRLMDATSLDLPDDSFDATVSSFLFCVLPHEMQLPALREIRRVTRPGGRIRLLEYVRPTGRWRGFVAGLWEPWMAWAYGAGFDRHTERYLPAAGLDLLSAEFVVPDFLKLLRIRVPD